MVNFCAVIDSVNKWDKILAKNGEIISSISKTKAKNPGELQNRLSEEREQLWLTRINRKDLPNIDKPRVCSDHVWEGNPCDLLDKIILTWAPS